MCSGVVKFSLTGAGGWVKKLLLQPKETAHSGSGTLVTGGPSRSRAVVGSAHFFLVVCAL